MDDDLADGLREAGAEGPRTLDDQAKAALAEASTWVGDGVFAVGLGRADDGAQCIVAHVGEPAPDLPVEVGGLPVQVVGSGPIQALDELDTDDPA